MYKLTWMIDDMDYPLYHYFESLNDLYVWWAEVGLEFEFLLDLLFDHCVYIQRINDTVSYNLEEVDE